MLIFFTLSFVSAVLPPWSSFVRSFVRSLWFVLEVIANIPTFFDQGTSNNIETYSLDETGRSAEPAGTGRRGPEQPVSFNRYISGDGLAGWKKRTFGDADADAGGAWLDLLRRAQAVVLYPKMVG